jgi:hypothetical protein
LIASCLSLLVDHGAVFVSGTLYWLKPMKVLVDNNQPGPIQQATPVINRAQIIGILGTLFVGCQYTNRRSRYTTKAHSSTKIYLKFLHPSSCTLNCGSDKARGNVHLIAYVNRKSYKINPHYPWLFAEIMEQFTLCVDKFPIHDPMNIPDINY